jgi:hypothetical protein
MPVIYREEGFRIVIWPNDHQPPHVHCFKANVEAVILLDSGRVREANGMSARDVCRAVEIVSEHQDLFLNRWREIHGF